MTRLKPVKCWICRFALKPWEPVCRHQTTVVLHGDRVDIEPLAHIECVARIRLQASLDGWSGPKDTGDLREPA